MYYASPKLTAAIFDDNPWIYIYKCLKCHNSKQNLKTAVKIRQNSTFIHEQVLYVGKK